MSQLFCIAPLTIEHKCVSTCTTRIHSSSVFHAQNPALIQTVQQQSVKVYLQNMYNGNVSLRIFSSLPFSPTIFYRGANSIFLSIPLYRSRLDAQNPVFEIAHQGSVQVCSTHVVVKNSLWSMGVFVQLV